MGLHPLWFFFIFTASIFVKSENSGGYQKGIKNTQNSGTVLFMKSHCNNYCWVGDEVTILNSRKLFQDLLPKINVINSENDEYIALLLDYIHICLECIRKAAIGKTRNLMLRALADTLGGYLHVYILPLTKHSYYAGNIKYSSAKKLFDLYDELKHFLRTNGAGWMKPVEIIARTKVLPTEIKTVDTNIACNDLITYPLIFKSNKQKFKRYASNKRKNNLYQKKSRHSRTPKSGIKSEPVMIPLPFLDNDTKPNSIAIPFKSDTLQSLYSEKSAFAVEKYYVTSVNCIKSKSNSGNELMDFNKRFSDWLLHSVQNHLYDEKWYPAFGGILRVIEKLQERGTKKSDSDNEQTNGEGQNHSKVPEKDHTPFSVVEIVLLSIGIILMLWLLIGLCIVCYKFLRRGSKQCYCEDSSKNLFSVWRANKDYGRRDLCTTRLFEKTKEKWSKSVKRCPGKCDDRYIEEERCLTALTYSSKDTVPNSSYSCKS